MPDTLADLASQAGDAADGVEVGSSPVPGLTLRRLLRGHEKLINQCAWSPDGERLASPSKDGTIRIWDVARGETTAVLEEHTDGVNSVAWSPDGARLASASDDRTVRIWRVDDWSVEKNFGEDKEYVQSVAFSPGGERLAVGFFKNLAQIYRVEGWELLHGAMRHNNTCQRVAWSPDGKLLATASREATVRLWDTETGEVARGLEGHRPHVMTVAWSPDGRMLASGSTDQSIRIWDPETGAQTTILERHTETVEGLAFDPGSRLLASTDCQTLRLWRCDTWDQVAVLGRTAPRNTWPPSPVFHPRLPRLATLGENDQVVFIWDLEPELLLGQSAGDSVRYTTAKLVLVGDSGVGKTGLGWRLAHGEFKELPSTHGQQFWVVAELGATRDDGTRCEAVLWDLAGQHVYRAIHSIFLDKVDAAMVLFDPTNRQNPLKGAQYWLEELRGKSELPPSVLVGARIDRGAPTVSRQELDQFCQRYGVSGGYLGTSAMRGDGLAELVDLLRAQIPWDEIPDTVTTATFKRIKDFLLALKEQPDRQGVLMTPERFLERLREADAEWEYSRDEVMTAIGHLETHGFVAVLRSSSGEEHILLTPDLLVDLASSIVLEADKHPRELGAVSEQELLDGKHGFEELEGLEEAEQQVLLEAAVMRFLEHNVCFRETYGDETLLIFPGLIKQKRPLASDFEATEDMSYVVRGRVENLYAMLVVLLGYSPAFSRINQWQNQAQYEMGEGEICGFRMIEDREGEIELVLYSNEQMPDSGRESFQELFEIFLYQRQVEVRRFPPVVCPKGHRLDRSAVINLVGEGQTEAFCTKCGAKVELPEEDRAGLGIATSDWLEREEAGALLRSTYETHLARVNSYRRGWAAPRCYLSHAPGEAAHAEKLAAHLKDAGVYLVEDTGQLGDGDHLVLLETAAYKKAFTSPPKQFQPDVAAVKQRLAGGRKRLISLAMEDAGGAAGHDLESCTPGAFGDPTHYLIGLFDLVLSLYAIPFSHKGFAPLRESLHEQWEKKLAGRAKPQAEKRQRRFAVALSFPGERREFVEAVAQGLASSLGEKLVFYDAFYEAELARPGLDDYLQTIYHDDAELVVVFLCKEYEQKEWTGLEWRAVRNLIKKRRTASIMLVQLDKGEDKPPGLFEIDGYVDVRDREPAAIAELILERLSGNRREPGT